MAGARLADAVSRVVFREQVDVPAYKRSGGIYCNAATVIETHHADQDMLIMVGGNRGKVVPDAERDDLRDRVKQLEAELECAKAAHLNACATIANMHRAAVGEVTGPKRGVVEDIEDLRLERDALLASKQLEDENKRLRDALTRISETLADVLDGSRVQEMQVRLGAQQDQVAALQAELATSRELKQMWQNKANQLEAENKRLREALNAIA